MIDFIPDDISLHSETEKQTCKVFLHLVHFQESSELTALTHGDNLPIYTADLNETPKLTFQVN